MTDSTMHTTPSHTEKALPLAIALIGGIASGKSLVSELFAEQGIPTFDADQVSRELVLPGSPCYPALRAHLGDAFFNEDDTLNRAKLRAHVFQNPDERLWLESLLHPAIRLRLKELALHCNAPICLIAIPLLKRRQDYEFCSRVLYVHAPRSLQLQRLIDRDHLNRTAAELILDAQPNEATYRALADDEIENSDSVSQLKRHVAKWASVYRTLAERPHAVKAQSHTA